MTSRLDGLAALTYIVWAAALFVVVMMPFALAFVPVNNSPRSVTTRRMLLPREQQIWYRGGRGRDPTTAEDDCCDVFRLFVAARSSSAASAEQSADGIASVTVIPDLSEESSTTKFRRLKDLMWVREAEEDVTAAEFACSVDSSSSNVVVGSSTGAGGGADYRRTKKRAIDYDKLLSQLDRRIRDLACGDDIECIVSTETLTPGKGSGAMAYTEAQRNALLKRIIKARAALMETIKDHAVEETEDQPFSLPIPEITLPKEEDDPKAAGPKLYVRDDGTVDWDGALQDRSALQNFGTAVWARINGQNPEFVDEESSSSSSAMVPVEEHAPIPVIVKIEETDAIREERAKLDTLKSELDDMETKHLVLLNSALKEGQAVANINLATLEPSLRVKIRQSSERLEKQREVVSYQTLIYELERIFTYLSGELGNPDSRGYIPLQDRLNVAEFGLLESQVVGFNRLLEMGENVDTDVLAVVLDQVSDFKRRLGIDYYVTGVTFDWEAIQRWLGDLLKQAKAGLAFYVKGCELFWNDIVFSMTLIGRALQGYTLKPREVRNLRRTFKDIVTFIPVIIILIIPLSPVGHVLVFGAIQRFFPDFFPSCFTESRQNLLSLYESTEYTEVTIDESWNEKLARIASAIAFVISSNVRKLYAKVFGERGMEQKLLKGTENDGDEIKVTAATEKTAEDVQVNGEDNDNVEKRRNGKVLSHFRNSLKKIGKL